jgi:mannose-1-phosphate guanylyltransferase
MQALILAAGRGKRMRPLTDKIPKVMLPVGRKPFLAYLIEYLKKQGINEFILAVCWKKEKIKNYFGDGKKFGVEIVYSEEKKLSDTAGAIKNAENLIKNKNIIILNGDSFVDIDIKKMLKFHKEKKSPITMAVYKTKNPGRYGEVIIDENDIVVRFKEKAKTKRENFINAGVYIFQKKILKNFPKNKKLSLEKDIFPNLAGKIAAFKTKGYFIDIGTQEDYKKLKKEFKKIWQN